ncbi:MAG: nucleotidyltransferase family protein [Planctomycetes bacterium]|nr:nucleotidyltransferase family protein [Planctomycetota bacterium]
MKLHPVSLDRMVRAVEKVRERLLRTTSALEKSGIPYAVVGGNAVAAWVSRVDEAAVRNTQDVDVLIRRNDLERVKVALEAIGFVHGSAMEVEFFLDGPDAKVREALHLLMAGEKVKPEYTSATPDV